MLSGIPVDEGADGVKAGEEGWKVEEVIRLPAESML